MCRKKKNQLDIEFLEDRYQAKITDPKKYKKYYAANGHDHPDWPVITSEAPGEIQMFKWGLIPSWTPNSKLAKEFSDNNLNARCESVFEKKSFKHVIMNHRCLVPVSGFYESRHIGKDKIPYYIFPKNEPCFTMAGIYDQWENSAGETVNTYTILTCESNPLLSKIHNSKLRMPLILPQEVEMEYLNPNLSEEDLQQLFKPFDERLMDAYTIGKTINAFRADIDIPSIDKPVEYPELAFYD